MTLLIAQSFQAALTKLTNQEQKAVKQTAFDVQMNPDAKGLRYHKLDRTRDPRFWSLSVTMDIRIIVHRMESQTLLAYVDHHEGAYRWAQNRKIEVHPQTGAAQIVEVIESQETISVAKPSAPKALANFTDDELLGTGLPADNLNHVRDATEDTLLEVLESLPAEAAERLLNFWDGSTKPEQPVSISDSHNYNALMMLSTYHSPASNVPEERADPFKHPDARRRFRILTNRQELEQALDYPWDQWTVFLHPSQRELVERELNGPARVTGSAGTGKTIVALHRAVWLAKQRPSARVLLTTYTKTLARSLRLKLSRLVPSTQQELDQIRVLSLDEMLLQSGRKALPHPNFATATNIAFYVRDAIKTLEYDRHRESFVLGEFLDVVDAWQIRTLDDYLTVARLGRRTPLNQAQRSALWPLFVHVREQMTKRKLMTRADAYALVAEQGVEQFDHVIVDEAQDLSVAQLRFVARLIRGDGKNGLFFAGDLGQRIFQVPFSWVSLGIEIRGRSSRLRVNYRTSHQIRDYADRLLPDEIEDADGNREVRKGTVSVFNGPIPTLETFATADEEAMALSDWIKAQITSGMQPEEIGVFVRSADQIARAKQTVKGTGVPFDMLSETEVEAANAVALGTMHLAKGLEFRAVAVMACDDEVIPLQSRLENLGDQGDLDEVYAAERHLLYVACTRAREQLWVSGVEPTSEFLADLGE